jgi:uncharacterized protein
MPSALHLVRLVDCPPAPWRNGGGTARELLRWPVGADIASGELGAELGANRGELAFRVGVAEIERDGPFSAYPGVERWFAVLQGAGVRLALPQGEWAVAPGDPVLRFDGAAAPECRLVAGAVQALNFMCSGTGTAATMCVATAGRRLEGGARWRALYAHDSARLVIGAREVVCPAASLLWSDSPDADPWQLAGEAQAFWLELRP